MDDDELLREQFARLRALDRQTLPGFEATLRPRRPHPQKTGWWIVTAAAAVVMVVGARVALRPPEPSMADLMAWTADSDVLLDAAISTGTTYTNGAKP
jgi:hypothetical protein